MGHLLPSGTWYICVTVKIWVLGDGQPTTLLNSRGTEQGELPLEYSSGMRPVATFFPSPLQVSLCSSHSNVSVPNYSCFLPGPRHGPRDGGGLLQAPYL